MELDEMKSLWNEMSAALEKQQKTTDALIIKMTKESYKNKVSKIFIPEVIGAIVCFTAFLFIVINLDKLNTWYLLASGIISAIILLVLPILSIKGVNKIRSLNISGNNLQQTLLEYSKGKIHFVFVQKLSFFSGSILMLTILPVMAQLINGVDMFKENRLWLWYAVAFPFFLYFANWVFKNYVKITKDAEDILKELESSN